MNSRAPARWETSHSCLWQPPVDLARYAGAGHLSGLGRSVCILRDAGGVLWGPGASLPYITPSYTCSSLLGLGWVSCPSSFLVPMGRPGIAVPQWLGQTAVQSPAVCPVQPQSLMGSLPCFAFKELSGYMCAEIGGWEEPRGHLVQPPHL